MSKVKSPITNRHPGRPTITWRREDGETIRLCAPNYGEEDNCSQVKEYVGDSLTLININRSVSCKGRPPYQNKLKKAPLKC